ncbi:MAG: AAA family ATPase [Dehalococcoidia bacterium]
MKINRIELPGFGCISDFGAELSPGLNLFFGENEAGKSTLQSAICAMLYGFYENDRALKDETARHDRFRPWTGGVYRGALEYELTDGARYEIRRDFSEEVTTQLIDAATGLDISAQFGRLRHGNVPFARRHLGMSRGVFQSCAFISQGEIFEVTKGASPGQIGDAVAALADSARRDVSAARAIERLDAATQRIGSDRARTAELPRAREHLRRAREELKAGEEARLHAADRARDLEERRTLTNSLRNRLAETQALALQAQASGLRKRVESVAAAEQEAHEKAVEAKRLSAYASFPASLRDDLMSLRGRWTTLRDGLIRLQADQRRAAGAVSDDERLQYETIRSGMESLSSDQLHALHSAAFAGERGGVLAAIAAALRALTRALVGLMGRVLGRPRQGETPPPLAVSAEEARALLERHHRYLELRPRVEAAQRLAADLNAQEAALATIERQILALLAAAGISGIDIAEGLSAFEKSARCHSQYQAAITASSEAQRRRDAVLAGRSSNEIEKRLNDCLQILADLLARRPDLAGAESALSLEQLTQDRDRLKDELHAAQLDERALDEEVRLLLERHRHASELEEEAALWQLEVMRLQKARDAVALARSMIEEAMERVYRDFAPAVNTFLSEGIEYVTEGRYTRAHVDPASLKVSLLVPETGQVITDPPVSHGTRTMVYVLMRIGLAQHMSAIGEPVPLVLDDPFVDLDSRRLPLMLDFLMQLSSRMQVLFFTKEEAATRWFEDHAHGTDHRLHELTQTKLSPSLL